ncbi:MAG TPA: LamG domain-containing protein [Planctomycetota bacterium]|nr:LamG domain-containing protein [Planctomycetota bacterium]
MPTPAKTDAVDERREVLNGLREHLLLHLPFTSSLKDHSAHALELTSSGAIEVRDGAAHFPGDAYLTLPHIPLDNRAFAFALWIRPEGQVVGYGLLEQSGGGPGKLLHILMRDPDRPYFGFYMSDLRAPSSIQSERWTHLVFQFTGSHQQIWIDGQLSIERVSDPFLGESGETRIGKAPGWNNVPTQCFKGAMRDLRLYDVTLTDQQIRLLAGLDGNAPQKIEHPDDTF